MQIYSTREKGGLLAVLALVNLACIVFVMIGNVSPELAPSALAEGAAMGLALLLDFGILAVALMLLRERTRC